MRVMISRVLVASFAGLTLAASLLPVGDAVAAPYRDNWDGGWWYGWQGRAGGAFGYHDPVWPAPGVIVTAPYAVYPGVCAVTERPLYDAAGAYVGQQLVNVC